ncbi:hypothetical protein HK405_013306 [Cladochytrium tenue]|nr:hypothetical protein HK405_013306 [Cladochytrium tenue]
MAVSLEYTIKDNPFGDSNLSPKFVWVKKREQMKKGFTAAEGLKKEAAKRQEVKREDAFHLSQAKTWAKIRIQAVPIDILAMNISIATNTEMAQEFERIGLEMDTEELYLIFQNLVLSEVEELHKDIWMYLTVDENKKFWKAMLAVLVATVAVEEEITKMLLGKMYAQLVEIQDQVEQCWSSEDGYDGLIDSDDDDDDAADAAHRQRLPRLALGLTYHGTGKVFGEAYAAWMVVLLEDEQLKFQAKADEKKPKIKNLVVWCAKVRLHNLHRFLLMKQIKQLKSQAFAEVTGSTGGKALTRLDHSLLVTMSTLASSAE